MRLCHACTNQVTVHALWGKPVWDMAEGYPSIFENEYEHFMPTDVVFLCSCLQNIIIAVPCTQQMWCSYAHACLQNLIIAVRRAEVKGALLACQEANFLYCYSCLHGPAMSGCHIQCVLIMSLCLD